MLGAIQSIFIKLAQPAKNVMLIELFCLGNTSNPSDFVHYISKKTKCLHPYLSSIYSVNHIVRLGIDPPDQTTTLHFFFFSVPQALKNLTSLPRQTNCTCFSTKYWFQNSLQARLNSYNLLEWFYRNKMSLN